MINLFIDSSRRNLCLALTSDEKLIASVNTSSHGKHSNYLMSSLDTMLNDNNIDMNDIDNIVVINGPGSFTGIRVGVTVAKTLAWALSKKLYELSTLDALRIHDDNEMVISVFFDKENASYVGISDEKMNIKDYMDINDDRLSFENKKITIISYEENEFVKKLSEKLSNNEVNIKIVDEYDYVKVVRSALLNDPVMVHNSAPIYLKKIDAEKNK